MTGHIRVGVLGANPDRGWAVRSHLPAISASPQFVLTAVATTRQESADAARERFDARHAFTDPYSLVSHPDVDLVVVTVKVPAHLELVGAALDAGKHVYCEWPLAMTLADAAALTARASAAKVHAIVGLQGRFSPAVRHARAMIAEGSIGTVQSATVYSSRAKGATPEVPGWSAYSYDRDYRTGTVDILGGHALDLVQHLLGPIRALSARTSVRTPALRIAETGEPVNVTAADHLLATTELESGALVSIHLHDGEAARPRTRIEISGTEGDLALISAPEIEPAATQLQMAQFELHEARPGRPRWTPIPVGMDHASALPLEAINVARVYDQIAADLRDGTREAPDFHVARALHELMEQIPAPAVPAMLHGLVE